MRKAARVLARAVATLVALVAAIWAFAPLEPAGRGAAATASLTADPAILAAREAAMGDVVPGAEARVVWAGAPGEATRWAVLYLHGFSASSEEIRPVPDRLAEALGANLVFNRLPGHGRGAAAMGEATATEWIDDTDLMLDIARGVGERVLVVATSTGGTLAAFAATEPDMAADVAGFVFVSPNFAVASRGGRILEWPLARLWTRLVLGGERGFEPLNERQARYWTERYPTTALVRMGALLREVRSRDLSVATAPALFIFSDGDRVVSAAATRRAAGRWGGDVTLAPLELPGSGVDPSRHVIAGDIVSPAMTVPVTGLVLDWVGGLQD
ncbi:alpha/beta fold hydrolase [Roseibacterium sp. SDUM158017]|uniref:alpha/beta hydrolase n=1 Tax=Roseicyclus salinarum TaxID=3036773 RepID=UPI00241542C4|nr:alpha/beta hydrolase [Roseibacterium sp. SDUM158017]MDG4649135.1 alpha/beta fold hydrolase [Roseibacterium sp. SDUM158017]